MSSGNTQRELSRLGVTVQHCESISAGVVALNEAAWHVVLIAPSIELEGDGVRFVRAMKFKTRLI